MASGHKIVTSDKWMAARKQLLAKEKAFTRLADKLARERRALPWEAVREGVSVFAKNAKGKVCRTYSTFARGIEALNLDYKYLDVVPRGRDEARRGPFWVRRRDEYARQQS